MIRDHIIRVHSDEALQTELLKLSDDSTLDKVVELCERHEDAVAGARELQTSQQRAYPVNMVTTKGKPKASPKPQAGGRPPQPPQPSSSKQSTGSPQPRGKQGGGPAKKQDTPGPTILCTWFCGTRHLRGQEHCPALGQYCTKCNGKNHFEEVCRRPAAKADWKPRSEESAKNHRRMQQAYAVSEEGQEYEATEDVDAVYESDEEILRHDPRQQQSQVTPPKTSRRVSHTPPSLVVNANVTSDSKILQRTVQHGSRPQSMKVSVKSGGHDHGGSSSRPCGKERSPPPAKKSDSGQSTSKEGGRTQKSGKERAPQPTKKVVTETEKPVKRNVLKIKSEIRSLHTQGGEKRTVSNEHDEGKGCQRPRSRETTAKRTSHRDRHDKPKKPRSRSPSQDVDKHRRRESTAHHRSRAPPPRKEETKSPVRHPSPPPPEPTAAETSQKPTTKKNEEELDFECDVEDVNEVSASCTKRRNRARTWDEMVTLNGRTLRMKVDSGSTVCTILLRDFKRLRLDEKILQPPQRRIVTYCQNKVEPLGEFEAVIRLRGRQTKSRVFLLENDCAPLLSCPAGAELGLFSFSESSLIDVIQDSLCFLEFILTILTRQRTNSSVPAIRLFQLC